MIPNNESDSRPSGSVVAGIVPEIVSCDAECKDLLQITPTFLMVPLFHLYDLRGKQKTSRDDIDGLMSSQTTHGTGIVTTTRMGHILR